MVPRIARPCAMLCSALVFPALVLVTGCRAEFASKDQKVTYGTHLVLLESGIHWAEWLKEDGSPCGDVYKWNNQWMADTYRDGLSQTPFDNKDDAVAWVQKWCK